MSRFEAGKRYGFMTDYMDMEGSYKEWWDCTARSAQYVTLSDMHGRVKRYKIYNHSVGCETVYPDGRILTSNKVLEAEE